MLERVLIKKMAISSAPTYYFVATYSAAIPMDKCLKKVVRNPDFFNISTMSWAGGKFAADIPRYL